MTDARSFCAPFSLLFLIFSNKYIELGKWTTVRLEIGHVSLGRHFPSRPLFFVCSYKYRTVSDHRVDCETLRPPPPILFLRCFPTAKSGCAGFLQHAWCERWLSGAYIILIHFGPAMNNWRFSPRFRIGRSFEQLEIANSGDGPSHVWPVALLIVIQFCPSPKNEKMEMFCY